MIVNTRKFEEFLRKATLAHTIDFVQFDVTSSTVSSRLISQNRDAIVILKLNNSEAGIFQEVKGEYEFNFSEPAQKLVPYLAVIDTEEAIVEVKPNFINLVNGKMKSKVSLDNPESSKIFNADAPKNEPDYFVTLPVDSDFLEDFSKIKKIGSRFGKIYFTVRDGKLYIETTDKTNAYANTLDFELLPVEKEDFFMMFDYKNFTSLMSVLDSDKKYTISLDYISEKGLGMMFVIDSEKTEKFYLFSKKEI